MLLIRNGQSDLASNGIEALEAYKNNNILDLDGCADAGYGRFGSYETDPAAGKDQTTTYPDVAMTAHAYAGRSTTLPGAGWKITSPNL